MLYVCMYVSGFFPGRACGRGLGRVWDHIIYFDISSVEGIGVTLLKGLGENTVCMSVYTHAMALHTFGKSR